MFLGHQHFGKSSPARPGIAQRLVVMEPALTFINLLHLFLGFLEDPKVDKDHDDQGDVKGDDG